MAEAFPRGRFIWHELMTTDTAGAVAFYADVVGWRTRAWENDPSYTLWTMDGIPVGGLMSLPAELRAQGVPPHWLAYVAVPDADATARQATALGGKVVAGPQSAPKVGRWAVVKDPQGAVLAVLQPEGEPGGHDGEPKRGEFSWHELATTDLLGAWQFYQGLFGWKHIESMDMGPAGTYFMYGRTDRALGGIYNKPPEMPFPPHWLCYAKVPNADRAAETVKRRGGQVLNGPMDVPGGDRIAQGLDPQGAAFAVHAAAAAAAPPAPAPRPAAPKPAAAPRPRPAAPAAKPAAQTRPVEKKAAKKRVTKRPVKKRPVKKGATRTARKKKR